MKFLPGVGIHKEARNQKYLFRSVNYRSNPKSFLKVRKKRFNTRAKKSYAYKMVFIVNYRPNPKSFCMK